MGQTSGTRKKSIHGPGHGPGQGPGWGGGAKGAHDAIEPVPIEVNMASLEWLKENDPDEYSRRRAKSVARKDRAAVLEDELFDIAMDPLQHPATRVQAIDKSLDRLKGKAVQRTELSGVDGEALKVEEVRRVIVDPKAHGGT